MKKRYFLILPVFISCSSLQEEKPLPPAEAENSSVPAPNTVVASDRQRIPDPLNEQYCSVEVIATERSDKGVYEVLVSYGHNEASSAFTMPDAEPPLIPEIRRDTIAFSYIIGFRHGTDTSFHPYFLVRAKKNQTEMKYIKAYSFR